MIRIKFKDVQACTKEANSVSTYWLVYFILKIQYGTNIDRLHCSPTYHYTTSRYKLNRNKMITIICIPDTVYQPDGITLMQNKRPINNND
jgi:hypothetical protein